MKDVWKILVPVMAVVLFVLSGVSYAGGDDPPPETGFKVFPILQVVAPNSVGMMWETHTADEATVKVSMNADLSGAKLFEVGTVSKKHKVTLGGLDANERYYYQVTSDGGSSAVRSFLTALEKGSREPFRFVVFGDTRVSPWYEDAVSWYGDNEDHLAVCQSIMDYAPDFVVHVGDFVFDGTDMDGIYNFFDVEKDLLAETPLLPTYGNHEFSGGSGTGNTLMDGYMIPAPGGGFAWYSYNYGNVHILVLNTGAGVHASDNYDLLAPGSPQYQFAASDLADAENDPAIDHILVSMHVPLYSVAGFGDNQKLIGALEPLFIQHGVKAVLVGHEHDYQHQELNGIHHILSGGGGASIMDMAWHGGEEDSAANLIKYDDVLNYVIVDVNQDTLSFEVRKVEGHGDKTSSMIESFTL